MKTSYVKGSEGDGHRIPESTFTNVDAQPGHAEHKSTKEDAGGTREGAKGLGSDGPDAHVSSGTGAEGPTPTRLLLLAAARSP